MLSCVKQKMSTSESKITNTSVQRYGRIFEKRSCEKVLRVKHASAFFHPTRRPFCGKGGEKMSKLTDEHLAAKQGRPRGTLLHAAHAGIEGVGLGQTSSRCSCLFLGAMKSGTEES